MSYDNQALYQNQARVLPRHVWFEGSTALYMGQGLCYNRDYGTATDADGRRDKFVELPSGVTNANAQWFAGVSSRAYPAVTGGQWIDIYEPGSVCQVAVGYEDAVIGAKVTCCASAQDPGRFVKAGFNGKGTARLLETDSASTIGSSLDGSATLSGTTGKTVTKTAAFASAAVGDKVVLFSIEDDGTNSGTEGIYEIATVTDDD